MLGVQVRCEGGVTGPAGDGTFVCGKNIENHELGSVILVLILLLIKTLILRGY
jgi:hypothetical protein